MRLSFWGLLLVSGCKVFDPSLLDDAGVGAACPLNTPPQPADEADPGGELELFFALRDIELDQGSDRWRTIGYDLDGRCSLPNSPDQGCRAPIGPSVAIDGEGGIDNVLGADVLPLLAAGEENLAAEAQLNQERGLGAVLLRIRGWNGQPNDSRVEVVFAQSVFGTPPNPDGSRPNPVIPAEGVIYEDGGMPPLPRWDGSDFWWARSDNFTGGDVSLPRVSDANAHIVDDVLVARIPDGSALVFAGAERGVTVRLTDAVLTAEISDDGVQLNNALLAGRWAIEDILQTTATVGICQDSTEFGLLDTLLQTVADVRSTRGSDGPDAICDAISVGLRFRGVLGQLGGTENAFPLQNRCPGQ